MDSSLNCFFKNNKLIVEYSPLKDEIWGSLSLPFRFKPDLGLFRTFGVDLSTSPGRGCRRPLPCVGPVGVEPTLTRCKSSGWTTIPSRS